MPTRTPSKSRSKKSSKAAARAKSARVAKPKRAVAKKASAKKPVAKKPAAKSSSRTRPAATSVSKSRSVAKKSIAKKAVGAKTKTAAKPTRGSKSSSTLSPTLREALDRFDAQLDALGDDFGVHSAREKPPSAGAIAAAEKQIGRAFPAEYRALVERYGALVVDVAESVWPRPREYDVRPSWQMDFGRALLGVSKPLAPFLDVAKVTSEVSATQSDSFLPVYRRLTGNGDYYGFDDSDRFGRLDHEDDEFEEIGTLFDFLAEEIESLQADRERLRTEPIAEANDDDVVDDRQRHVVLFDVSKQPASMHAALREYQRELANAFPGLEVEGKFDGEPWTPDAESFPAKFLHEDRMDSIDLRFTYGKSGKLKDDFELYIYVYPTSYSLTFRTLKPRQKDPVSARGVDLLMAAMQKQRLAYETR